MTVLEDFLNVGTYLNVTIQQKNWKVTWECLTCKKDVPKKEVLWRRGLPFCSYWCAALQHTHMKEH